MFDERELNRAAELLASSEPVMIFGHEWPDGDAIGAVLGLGIALAEKGKRVQMSWPGPLEMPQKYQFLPEIEKLVASRELRPEGIAIAVDCATEDRLKELKEVAFAAGGLINIDHHPDNTRFGSVNLVDETAAATCEILYAICEKLGFAVGYEAALCLYTGIVTDTGRFQFSNTTAGTLATASGILSKGVKPNFVYENVYQSNSLAYIRLTGEVLTRAVYDEDLSFVYGWIKQEDLKKFGVRLYETEDLIDDLRALKGHVIAAVFKEQPSGAIRVSVRSRLECDIGSIARKLGGGGHRVAAGYTSARGTLEEAVEELKGEIIASGRSGNS